MASGGGVLRDSNGKWVGGFSIKLGACTQFGSRAVGYPLWSRASKGTKESYSS